MKWKGGVKEVKIIPVTFCVVFEPICGHSVRFPLSIYTSQGWVLGRSGGSDPLKENGRKFSSAGPVASKFRLEHGR